VIHYHGGPITPAEAAAKVWAKRHGFVSAAHRQQLEIAIEVCQSFAVDNGAFSAWIGGKDVDWNEYYEWVASLIGLPGLDFAIIPDVIDGTEAENDALVDQWPHGHHGVPVWHMHESIERLISLCKRFPRVAIGSSGEYATVGSKKWFNRMAVAFNAICDERGLPMAKIHGLRMLDPAIFSLFPFASADSTNIAQNIGIDSAWRGTYQPPDKTWRAMVMAERIESHNSARRWNREYEQLELA
jgi:hypothetical protein